MVAGLLAAGLVGEARADGPRVGVASAMDALGGLKGPLEAQGWTITTDRSSAISPGDIYDPRDQQVQVLGKACFDLAAVRTGVAPSMEVDRAIHAGGKVRFGFWGVSASGSGSIDATISKAQVAEIAVADLDPADTCARQLQGLARAGADVASWSIVTGTLVTDLDLEVCGGGDVGVLAGAAEVGVGTDSCRKTSGTSVVLAVRREPLATILATARIPLPTSTTPLKEPKRNKQGRPCWLDGPCAPYVEPTFAIAVGKGPTLGTADNAARASLLDPFEQARTGLHAMAKLDDPPPLVPAETVTIADRYHDDTGYYSLLAIDRSAVHARLEGQIVLAEAALAAPVPADPVAAARALGQSLPIARQLAWWQADRAVLRGAQPPQGTAFTDRVAQYDAAVAAIAVRPPTGTGAAPVSTALERAGLQVAAAGGAKPALTLSLALAPPKSKVIQGFTNVTRTGVVELRAGERLVGSVDAEASASSEDAARASADAETALWNRVSELSVGLVRDAIGAAPAGATP